MQSLSDYDFDGLNLSADAQVVGRVNSFLPLEAVKPISPIAAEIIGTPSDDIIFGTGADDEIYGAEGHDRLYGGEGHDIIFGDDGQDILYGGNGDDTLLGGDGHDIFYGQGGSDLLFGGAGNDFFIGSRGEDRFEAGEGFDTLSYSRAESGVGLSLLGGGYHGIATYDSYGDDYETGFARVIGSAFDDIITGDLGDNILIGGAGDDYLQGGGGTSGYIDGNDKLIGGAGTDSYGFYANTGGRDVIVGFTPDELIYMLSDDPLFGSYEEVMSYARDIGSNVIFEFIPGARTLLLTGVNIADLGPDNFDFSREEPAPVTLTDASVASGEVVDYFDLDVLI